MSGGPKRGLISSTTASENTPRVGGKKIAALAEILEASKPTAAFSFASNSSGETQGSIPCQPSSLPAQAHPAPYASALHGRRFLPASPFSPGFIDEPKGRPLSGGAYSDVWRCNVRFFTPSENFPSEVAVKVLRAVGLNSQSDADANLRLLQRFEQEAITWSGLPNHPNIVPLIGWTLTPNLSFISPWYKQGNLFSHLKNLSETQKIRILLGISKGLEYLHSRNPPVVHGDLKPDNILFSDSGEPLLADFGLSTILGEESMYTSSHRVGGSTPWMSPESIQGAPKSCQSDTYSFGNLAFTVMTGELPYAGLPDYQISHQVCHSNNSNGPVEDWNRYPQLRGLIKDLLTDCWSRSPSWRPSMSAIVRQLTTLLESPEMDSCTLPCVPATRKGFGLAPFLALAIIFIGPTLYEWTT